MKFKYIYILILSTIICTEIIASEYELNNIMLKNRNFLDEQNNFNRNKVRLKNTVKNDSTIVDLEKAIIFFNNLIKNKKSIFLTGFSKEPFINNDDDNSSEQIFEGNSNNKYYNSVYAVNYYYGEIKRVPISLNRKLRLIPTKLDIDNSLVIAKLNLKEDSDKSKGSALSFKSLTALLFLILSILFIIFLLFKLWNMSNALYNSMECIKTKVFPDL